MEVGIDEYQDYEQRMQILIGPKKYEPKKYEFHIEEPAPADDEASDVVAHANLKVPRTKFPELDSQAC